MFTNLHPVAKQILGAAAGVALSLAVYGIYTLVSPPVHAFFSSVLPVQESKFTDAERAERQKEIIERAKGLIEKELEQE